MSDIQGSTTEQAPARRRVAVVVALLAIVVAMAAVGALAWAAGSWTARWSATASRSELRTDLPAPVASRLTRALVLDTLADAAELATVVYLVDAVSEESQERLVGPVKVGATRVLYVASGRVEAQVDLADIGSRDVSVAGGLVDVRLPAPRLSAVELDPARSYTYDVDRSLLGPPDAEIEGRARSGALDRVVRKACQEGILDEANARAERLTRALLAAADVSDVRIATTAPGDCVPPATATPPTVTPLVPGRTPAAAPTAAK